jgi:transposase InsO family protein
MLSKDFNVESICKYMKISKSGYYYWLKNTNLIKSYQQSRMDLIKLVSAIHQKKPSYGYRRINALIKNQTGWVVSDLQVHKCCKYLGVKSKTKRYKHKNVGKESLIYPNLIYNNWQVDKPMKIVVSDTTGISFKGKGYEWTYYIDVFNNEIIGSSIGNFHHGNNYQNHMKALNNMLESQIKRRYKTRKTILHTDQGAIYSSKAYKDAHRNYNIVRSMSRIATPTDNPIIESLNGWIKDEIKCDIDKDTFDSVQEFEDYLIYYFNYERPSSKLNNKSPIQYRLELGIR